MINLTKEEIQNMPYEEFDKLVRHVHDKRKHKKTNTYHSKYLIREMRKEYHYIYEIGETKAFQIIKRCLELMVDKMVFGGGIMRLPYSFGKIMLVRGKPNHYLKKMNMVVNRVYDWQRTMRQWHKNGQCNVLYYDNSIIDCKPIWIKNYKTYRNLYHYDIKFERPLRRKIKEADIKNKLIYYEYK